MAHSPISISFETQILAVLHQNLGAGELRNVCLADCAGSTASLKANGDCLSVFHTRDLLINTQSQRNDAKTVNPCGFCTGACRNRFGNFAPRHGPILLKSLFSIDLVVYNTGFQGKNRTPTDLLENLCTNFWQNRWRDDEIFFGRKPFLHSELVKSAWNSYLA